MSTKTIKQRIAVVAVSALTAGVLSVMVAPSASAGAIATHEHNTLILATTTASSGTAASALTAAADQTFASIGWVADTRATSSTTDGGVFVNGSAIATGQVLSGAKIAFIATGAGFPVTDGLSVVVTGGTLTTSTVTNAGGAPATTALGTTTAGNYRAANAGVTAFVLDGGDVATGEQSHLSSTDRNAIAGIFNVGAAVGSIATISIYSGANITNTDTATNGTLRGQWALTVVASSSVGEYAASKSDIYQQACINNATTGTSGTSQFDTTSSCTNGQVGVVWVDIDDANGANVTSGTVYASSSAGNITSSGTTTTGSIIAAATTNFATVVDDSDGRMWFYVKQPTANTAGETVVTISLNGTVIATKPIKWTGDIAKLSILSASSKSFAIGQSTDTSEGNIGDAGVVYVAQDSANNVVNLTSHPSINSATGALVGASLSATSEQTTYAAYQTSSRGYGFTTMLVPSNTLSGTSTYSIKITNAAGATITSSAVTVSVSRGDTNSFEASWDKASYATGDVATLTITLKDAYGNLMATGTPLTGLSLETNTAGLTLFAGTPCVATSTVTDGVRTCKYSVLNTAGNYAYSVDVTTATPQSATIGTVKVADASGAVSNADVLKSIVALIASINKQIQALQKLILKR